MQMETKDRIRGKAGALFLKYGIRSVSMDDIANQLGMSKKTLYQFYTDKDELVLEVVDAHLKNMEQNCGTCQADARDAIHEIFITMDRILQDFSDLNPNLLYDLEKFHYKAFQRFREHRDKFLLKLIQENIMWGIQDELYRADINVDVLTKYRIESMMIPFNVSLFPPGKYNLAEVSSLVIENFIYGLSTSKGHKLIQKYNELRKKNMTYEEVKK